MIFILGVVDLISGCGVSLIEFSKSGEYEIVTSVVLFPPPFYFVFDISNVLSYIQNNFSYELARPIMGTIFLVYIYTVRLIIEHPREWLASLADYI